MAKAVITEGERRTIANIFQAINKYQNATGVKDIERFGRMIRFVVTSDGKTLRMQFRCETTAKATELEETLLRFVNSVCDRAPLAP